MIREEVRFYEGQKLALSELVLIKIDEILEDPVLGVHPEILNRNR
jgi:hypothetical protein